MPEKRDKNQVCIPFPKLQCDKAYLAGFGRTADSQMVLSPSAPHLGSSPDAGTPSLDALGSD